MKKFLFILFLGFGLVIGGNRSQAQVGPEGKFITFNGLDQYISIPNHADLNIQVGESFTIAFRMNPDNFDSIYHVLTKGNEMIPGSRYGFTTLKTATAPNLSLKLINSHDTDLSAPYLTTLEAGKWIHVAWVFNPADKSSKVYINGFLAQTTYNQVIGRQAVDNSQDLTIGCGWTDAANPTQFQFWPGQLDELRIWKRALSSNDLLADMSSPKANTDHLVAAYDFENVSSSTVPDISGKGHSGQMYGYGIRVLRTLLPTGRGNYNERLVGFRVISTHASESVKNISINLTGTTALSDITYLKVYCTGSSERFNPETATLFGFTAKLATHTVIYGNKKLAEGANYFWVTADINSKAIEGHQIRSSVISYTQGDGTCVDVPEFQGSRTILLANKLLFSGGDGGSKYYRIPAVVTAMNGNLITATDKRWDDVSDLPNNIDVVTRYSTNRGRTWSTPVTIAGEGTNSGFGDPSLVLNQRNGEVICLFAGGNGFFNSTSQNPIRIFLSKSKDAGISWSTPRDLTPDIYGAGCPNLQTSTWQGAFVTSGSATQLSNGRLMAALSVRETLERTISNFVLYSDDDGQTWKTTVNKAISDGSEAKIVELDNGNLLMSIRSTETRRFSVSFDQGMTWCTPFLQPDIVDPGCNGDMIRYTSVSGGFNKNRMLHSIPYANSRSNVSVLLSYDEGRSWPIRKTIFKEASAYSSLCALNDGSIGIYYEVGEYETYQMYFVRFSLDWLSNGTDTWTHRNLKVVSSTDLITNNNQEFITYPNPADDWIHITGPFQVNDPVELFNTSGVLMKRCVIQNPDAVANLSVQNLPAGIYILKTGKYTSKIVVR